ncbi:MAG TPA: LysR family transcriptional regulator [Rhodocyclaceae bacterium]|jgi:DNA-binding transcriptional LysR family regulator|nr:LysR family transcriptional regulator [Rhodocyclaceae bacterium]
MDKIQAMRTFVRVVEAASFSAVANEINTSQSAVSKQVAALEADLGVKLLTRTTRALTLTDEGERYFEHARRLVADISEVESSIRKGKQQLTGWLRVGASVGFGRIKLMPFIQSFMAKHPSLKIDLRLNDGFVDVVEQGLDVVVRIGTLQDSTMIARRVGMTYRIVLAHRSYVQSLASRSLPLPTIPEELLSHNCLVYTEMPTKNLWTFTAGASASEAVGTKRTIRVEGNLQTNSSEVIRAAVLAGMGIAYAPIWMFEEEIRRGEMHEILPDWKPKSIPISLVSPPERFHSAKVKAFADHIGMAMEAELKA